MARGADRCRLEHAQAAIRKMGVLGNHAADGHKPAFAGTDCPLEGQFSGTPSSTSRPRRTSRSPRSRQPKIVFSSPKNKSERGRSMNLRLWARSRRESSNVKRPETKSRVGADGDRAAGGQGRRWAAAPETRPADLPRTV